jgi:hypothetical protein
VELIIRILHVGLASAWFGHKLLIPADMRRSIAAGEGPSLMVRLAGAERLGQITGVGTLATGLALVWLIGPGSVRAPIWVGAGAVIVAFVLGATIARPASNRLRAAVAAGDVTAGTHAATLGRLLMVESVLWGVALVSMLV